MRRSTILATIPDDRMLRLAPAHSAVFVVVAALALATPAFARDPEPALFRVIAPLDEVTIGLTYAELGGMGSGPKVERTARKLLANGQFTT
jgi:hypothetical protein